MDRLKEVFPHLKVFKKEGSIIKLADLKMSLWIQCNEWIRGQ